MRCNSRWFVAHLLFRKQYREDATTVYNNLRREGTWRGFHSTPIPNSPNSYLHRFHTLMERWDQSRSPCDPHTAKRLWDCATVISRDEPPTLNTVSLHFCTAAPFPNSSVALSKRVPNPIPWYSFATWISYLPFTDPNPRVHVNNGGIIVGINEESKHDVGRDCVGFYTSDDEKTVGSRTNGSH